MNKGVTSRGSIIGIRGGRGGCVGSVLKHLWNIGDTLNTSGLRFTTELTTYD